MKIGYLPILSWGAGSTACLISTDCGSSWFGRVLILALPGCLGYTDASVSGTEPANELGRVMGIRSPGTRGC